MPSREFLFDVTSPRCWHQRPLVNSKCFFTALACRSSSVGLPVLLVPGPNQPSDVFETDTVTQAAGTSSRPLQHQHFRSFNILRSPATRLRSHLAGVRHAHAMIPLPEGGWDMVSPRPQASCGGRLHNLAPRCVWHLSWQVWHLDGSVAMGHPKAQNAKLQ